MKEKLETIAIAVLIGILMVSTLAGIVIRIAQALGYMK